MRFQPGEQALTLTSFSCSCGAPEHRGIPAGSIVLIEAVGPFGPGFTELGGVVGFLSKRFDYWVHLPAHDKWTGFLCQDHELSKLQGLSETLDEEVHEETEA